MTIDSNDAKPGNVKSRRSFLFTAVAATAAVGGVAALWPLVAQLKPGADVVAAGPGMEVDLTGLEPAAQKTVRWQNVPVVFVRRTQAMLEAMQQPAFVARLIDPNSTARQQPAYARNWHRSIDPTLAVLVGVCTACSCAVQYEAEATLNEIAGGFICPCCASHFDPAGRIFSGLARKNLAVPPHRPLSPMRIELGRNLPGDELFTLKSVETL
jgi:ubiquinol-cytochrome c reductase iron-sulfur subunit